VLPRSIAPRVSPQPRGVGSFIELAGCQCHHSLSGIFLCGFEVEAVEFEEEDTNHKAGALVAIDKRMVADDASRVKRRHLDDIRRVRIGVVLAGTGEGGVQQPSITQPSGAAMERQEPVVDRDDIALFDPEWFLLFLVHFERACSVLR